MPIELAKLEQIFGEAAGLAVDERAQFLDQACGGNAELRDTVESLLRAHDAAGTFLQPATTINPANQLPAEDVGSTIGRYKLLQKIGEGGFGVVYMAEQEQPIRRRVALKIIKLGMDTRQVIARFEAERQALAILDHPGIAKVHDGGATETGRPYFVMELVSGVPITEYCDRNRIGIRQRIEMFIQVCQAVQHAHQKGLIHRDLKPSNVLVSTVDGRPVAKVIDFGIAKATAARLTEKTLFTEFRTLIGTPEYMSPEQAEGSLDIDTRSDVYSLGALLYEILAGAPPFDPKELRSKAYGEMQRIIRELEPSRPSARVSTAANVTSIAAVRGIEPRQLRTSLHGELDWIVMKCLDKDRTRRYESAAALAGDAQRFLSDEPVSAVAPSRAYRIRKFVRRHKGPVTAVAIIFAALVVGIIGTTIGLISESRRRIIAEREQASAEFNLAVSLQSRGVLEEAEGAYRRSLKLIKTGDAPDLERTAHAHLRLAQTLVSLGRAPEAENEYRLAVANYQQVSGSAANVALALQRHALLLRDMTRFSEAELLFSRSLETYRTAVPPDHTAIARAATYYASILAYLDRHAAGERYAREAISEYRLANPVDHVGLGWAKAELSLLLLAQRRMAEAETEMLDSRNILGNHPEAFHINVSLEAFYQAWDALEPGKGHDLKARQWNDRKFEANRRLQIAVEAATRPAS